MHKKEKNKLKIIIYDYDYVKLYLSIIVKKVGNNNEYNIDGIMSKWNIYRIFFQR